MTIKEILFALTLVVLAFTAVTCCLKNRDICVQPDYYNDKQNWSE